MNTESNGKKREPDILRRIRILYVKQFFEKYTDEDNSASMSQLISYLKKHDIVAERKSLIDDIAALNEFGMEIQLDPEGKSRRLISRDFELAEIKFLMDCVESSRFLTKEKTNELLKKLGLLISEYQRIKLKHRFSSYGIVKAKNQHIFYNVDIIQRAISTHNNVSFRYFHYNGNKQLVSTDEFTVEPRHLLYENNNYYLLAKDSGTKRIYRIDKMGSVEIHESIYRRFSSFQSNDESMASVIKTTFGMSLGEKESVTMLFKNDMMDVVIDKFGEDVWIVESGKDHFKVTAEIEVSPQFFGWVFALGDKVMIQYPLKVAKQMKDMLKERHKAYREEHSRHLYDA